MTIQVHVYLHDAPADNARLLKIEALLSQIFKGQQTMANALDTKLQELTDAVAAETTVEQSALTLIQSIPGLISDAVAKAQAAGATDAELQAVTDVVAAIKANTAKLADAISSGTPAAPPAGTPATGQDGDPPLV